MSFLDRHEEFELTEHEQDVLEQQARSALGDYTYEDLETAITYQVICSVEGLQLLVS